MLLKERCPPLKKKMKIQESFKGFLFVRAKHLAAVFLALVLSFMQGGCSMLVNINTEDLYFPIVDLNIEYGETDARSPFADSIRNSFGNEDVAPPHYVGLLDTGYDALLARIHMIRHAQKAIYIQTFIWRDDESSRFVIDELLKAAKRGVEVYIIVDKLGFINDPDLIAYFIDAHPNIHLKLYNPSAESITPSALHTLGQMAFKFKKLNQRMHNKVFIVDDQIAITGGRNIENDYFDMSLTRNFKDRDVLVVGKVVKDMTRSFMKYWAFKWSVSANDFVDVQKSVQYKLYEKKFNKKKFKFGNLFSEVKAKSVDQKYIKDHLVDKMYKVSDIVFFVDDPGKNRRRTLRGSGIVAHKFVDLFEKAENEILLQTPYLVFDRLLLKSAKKIRRKNKQLNDSITTNSLE